MKRVFFFSFFIFPFFLFGEQLIEIADAETEQCPNGGIKIITGNDDDNNGSLEENEIKATKIVCNGKDGANGTDGEKGKQALVRTSDEAAGENCEAGGTKIEVGIDSNGDGELDEEEIDSNSTKYICNGKNGFQTIIKTSDPEAGFCLYGGTKIEVGLDKNGNGELDEGEIDSTRHICNDKDGKNGTDGENGQKALVRTSKETAGENCEAGGTKIEVGLDSNGDGELDEGEIDSNSTQYICNGKDGKNGTDGEKGEAGEKGEKGADGVKGEKGETGETGETGEKGKKGEKGETGEKGEKGPNGAVALVAVTDESAGENCTAGGKKIEIGLDANGNGELDEDEINRENVFFVCNGADAEESGLASSSTGCAILSVDGGEDAVFGIFSMILICCALFFKKILQI